MAEERTRPGTVLSPRRVDLDRLTPAELAIRAAVLEVEKLPADARLTDAVVLLMQARDKVADFVDETPEPGRALGSVSAKPKPALRRSLARWAAMSPSAIAEGSPAQFMHAMADAQHDIAMLAEQCKTQQP